MFKTNLKFLLLLATILSILACSKEAELMVKEIENPFPPQSLFPNLFWDGNEMVISYIHTQGDTLDQLYFSTFEGGQFTKPLKIAEGRDWFVNWADIPTITKSGNNVLASWLDKSDNGTYDYDVKMSLSNDKGLSWSQPFIPHKDGIAAEHGFVSTDVNSKGDFITVWLDGRDTKVVDENGKEVHGQMTLRSATIDSDGQMTDEFEIDPRVCDCCQTAVDQSDLGTMVVYRDRSAEEIRDNYFSLLNENGWSEPKPIHEDGWKIGGCPVNGPVIASDDKSLCVAWYTEANGKPEIYLAPYDPSSSEFGSPILISDFGVKGRLDLTYLNNGNLMVTWLEDALDNKAIIKSKIYDEDLQEIATIDLGITSAARSSGFPKVLHMSGQVFVIHMDVDEGKLVTKIIS